MPRPLNKTQLLEVSAKEYDKLETYLAALSPEQMTAAHPPEWSVKDILAHLYAWQQMFFTWYETGLRGETPAVPAPGYNWGQLPALNQSIYERYHTRPLDEVLSRLRTSQQKTIKFIEDVSDADLTTPGLYPWMNKNTLMAYLNSITAAHFVWALKEIKKAIRAAGDAK
jgi:hypothetical protein